MAIHIHRGQQRRRTHDIVHPDYSKVKNIAAVQEAVRKYKEAYGLQGSNRGPELKAAEEKINAAVERALSPRDRVRDGVFSEIAELLEMLWHRHVAKDGHFMDSGIGDLTEHIKGSGPGDGLSDYHAAKAAMNARRIKNLGERLRAVKSALGNHNVVVAPDGDGIRIHRPGKGDLTL